MRMLIRVTVAVMTLTTPVTQEYLTCPLRPEVIEFIAVREGFHVSGSLPARMHNPGSLRWHGQAGGQLGTLGFAEFPSDSVGWSALERDVLAKVRQGIPLNVAWEYLQVSPNP